MSLALLLEDPSVERTLHAIKHFPFSKWQVVGVATGGYLAYKVARFLTFWFIDPQLSPLKSMPGPDSYDSLLWGDFRRILSAPPSSIYREWFAKYGHSFSYRGMFLVIILWSSKMFKGAAYQTLHYFRSAVSAPRIPKQ